MRKRPMPRLCALPARWARLAARWGLPAWELLADAPSKKPLFPKASLDILALESRFMPSWSAFQRTDSLPDWQQARAFQVGDFGVRPADGAVETGVNLDYHLSAADCSCTNGCQPAIVNDTSAVHVLPVIQAQIDSGGGDPVPSSITGTLTWNGTNQGGDVHLVSPFGHSAGDSYLISEEAGAPVTATGRYAWSLQIDVVAGGNTTTMTLSGTASVVVGDGTGNKVGPGWSVGCLDGLTLDTGGAMLVRPPMPGRPGGARYFTKSGGNYLSPANDFGALVKNGDGSFTYTTPQQVREDFDSTGRIVNVVEPNGHTLTYSFDGSGRLSQVSACDGGLTTFSYGGDGYLATVTEPGGRALTVAHDATTHDLTAITDPAGGIHTYTYNADHKLTNLDWGSQSTSLSYDTFGAVSAVDRRDSAVTSLSAQLSKGFGSFAASASDAVASVVTNALSDRTTLTLDFAGRAKKEQTPDGAVQQWAFNAAGLPGTYTDGLSRVTSFSYAASSGTSAGDLTEVDHPDGGADQYTYDATFHKPSTHTDPLSHVTTFSYEAVTGNLLTAKDALNHTTTYVWDTDTLTSVTDASNHTTTYLYDANDRVQTVIDPLSNRTTYGYDSAGNVQTVTDALNRTTTMAYDGLRRLLTRTDALGNTTSFSYDVQGHVTKVTDALTHQSTFAYDTRGNETGMTGAAGSSDQRRATMAYDVLDRLTASTDGLGHTTSFGYDAVGRMTTVTDPLSHTSTFSYDHAGQITAQTDPLNHTTTFQYDQAGRRTVVTDPLSHSTTIAYDVADNVLSVTDSDSRVTSFGYDALNRRTRELDGYGSGSQRTVTVAYDSVGNVTAVTDGLGHTTSYGYDSLNRQVTTTDPLSHTATTVYNAVGDPVQQIDALSKTTSYTYDALHQGLTVQSPAGGVVTTAYDAVGNTTAVTDALNHTTTTVFDSLNRAVRTIDALNHTTTVVYDAADNRTLVVDPDGNRTTFAYDNANRLTTQTDPLNHSSTFAYDSANRLTSVTDRLGRRIDYSYDDTNRETGEAWYAVGGSLDQRVTFSYDNTGHTLTAANAQGTDTYTYDALARVATAAQPFGLTLTYAYDAADNQTQVQDSKGGMATSVYDAANRLTSRQFTDGTTPLRFDYAYTVRNQVSSVTRYSDLAGSTSVGSTAYTYDDAGRVTNLWHKDGSNASLQNTTYAYDLADRLTAQTVDGTVTSYSYDVTNQLTNDGTNSYGFDANGNRNTGSYTTGTGNQVTSDGTWTYTYDAEGNRTKKSKGASAETWTYGYDQRNRLVWVEQRATDGGTLQQRVEYAYDAQDRRLSRVVKDGSLTVTATQRFGYDGQNVWADLDANNALVTRRLFGPGTDNVVARITASGGAAAWYLTDRQGSVTKVANGSGSVIDTLAYDGFGNVTSESNTANGDRYKYTGREWDDVTKLQYNRARYYDAATGSWVGMDPTGFIAGDTNLYRYVGNSGPNRTDPSGLRAIPIQQFFLPYGQGAWVNEKCAQLKRELEKIQAQLAEKRKEEAALTAAQRINSPIPGEVRALERRETELSRYDRLCNKQFTMFCQDPIKEMQINFPPISLDRLQAWLELYLFLGQTYGFPAPPKPA